jgi:hypothetical protein
VLLPGALPEELPDFLAQRTWVEFRHGLDDEVAFSRLVAGIQGHAPEHDTFHLPDEPAPYRGLLPFGKDHARFFFGREREIQTVLDKLEQHPFVAVVGASGVADLGGGARAGERGGGNGRTSVQRRHVLAHLGVDGGVAEQAHLGPWFRVRGPAWVTG